MILVRFLLAQPIPSDDSPVWYYSDFAVNWRFICTSLILLSVWNVAEKWSSAHTSTRWHCTNYLSPIICCYLLKVLCEEGLPNPTQTLQYGCTSVCMIRCGLICIKWQFKTAPGSTFSENCMSVLIRLECLTRQVTCGSISFKIKPPSTLLFEPREIMVLILPEVEIVDVKDLFRKKNWIRELHTWNTLGGDLIGMDEWTPPFKSSTFENRAYLGQSSNIIKSLD